MPVAPTYPGVYVEEVPSGVHPISGVPTAVGAFIGWFPKGQMNRAVEVLSFADVEREFGGLHTDSDTSFALQQFFLNGGGRAWVVRVAAPGSGATALGRASAAVPATTGTAFTLRARNEGAWGNDLRAQVIGPDLDNRFDLIVSLVGTDAGRAIVLQQETFRGLTCTSTTEPNYLPTIVNAASQLVTVDTTGRPAPHRWGARAPISHRPEGRLRRHPAGLTTALDPPAAGRQPHRHVHSSEPTPEGVVVKPTRRLALKKYVLSELTSDDLRIVAAGSGVGCVLTAKVCTQVCDPFDTSRLGTCICYSDLC